MSEKQDSTISKILTRTRSIYEIVKSQQTILRKNLNGLTFLLRQIPLKVIHFFIY